MPSTELKEKELNKVVYVGNFSKFWTTETYIARTLEDMGWKVVRCQEDEKSPKEIIKECSDAKFFLWTRTWVERMWVIQEVISKIKIPTVSLHLDLYFGLDREKELNLPFWKCDYVFTADGGHQDEFKKLGINHYWLSPGVYKKECVKGNIDKRLVGKRVAFLGSCAIYHKEWRDYRVALISWLSRTYKDKFIIKGGGQVEFPYGRCWGKEKNDLFATVPVIVGDSLASPYYWSDRVPETLGRGGFLVHPFNVGFEKEGYRYWKHFVPYHYGDFKTLKKIIDYYIEADEEREKIRDEGMKFVKENHSWENKMNYVLSILKKDGAI